VSPEDSSNKPRSKSNRLFIILAVYNFLNAALPAVMAIELLPSSQPLERAWSVFVGLATIGMLGLAVCLLARPRKARIAAIVAVLLLALHAIAVIPIGFSDKQSMGGGVLIVFGWIGTGVFAIVPVATLVTILLLPVEKSIPVEK
jgi:hypothetical protein